MLEQRQESWDTKTKTNTNMRAKYIYKDMGNEKRNDMRVTKSSNNSSGCDLRLNIPLCQEMCKNCIQGELTKVQIGFFKPCFSVT